MSPSFSRFLGVLVTFFLVVIFATATGIGVTAAFVVMLGVFVAVGLLVKPGQLRIEPEEQIVHAPLTPSGPAVWFRYAITLGLYEFWRRATRLTVTDRRVIYHAGLVVKSERSLPLHFLQDASLHTFLWSSHVSFSTAGGDAGFERFGPCWPDQARRLKDTILDRARQRAARTPASSSPPPQQDLVAQLRSLQELRDRGVLSPEEFAAAKGRVLETQSA